MNTPTKGSGFDDFDFEGAAPPDDAFDARVARRVEKIRAERGRHRQPPSIADGEFEKARVAAKKMSESGDWSRALPRHLVALFDLYHEHVYGVCALDLTPVARGRAAGMVGQLLRKHFGMEAGEAASEVVAYARCAAFLRWAWEREKKAEIYRRQVGQSGGRRLGWHYVFGGSAIADYAVELRRRESIR